MIDRRFWLAAGVAALVVGGAPATASAQQAVAPADCPAPVMTIHGTPVGDVQGDIVHSIHRGPCPPVVAAVEPPVEPVAPPPEPEPLLVAEMVNFEFDRTEILPQFEPTLNEVANVLRENPDQQVRLVGHTDSIGDPTYNMGLAERRSESVASYLQGRGASPEQMTLEARGEHEPIATNETPEGRFMNRRVEVIPVGPAV